MRIGEVLVPSEPYQPARPSARPPARPSDKHLPLPHQPASYLIKHLYRALWPMTVLSKVTESEKKNFSLEKKWIRS